MVSRRAGCEGHPPHNLTPEENLAAEEKIDCDQIAADGSETVSRIGAAWFGYVSHNVRSCRRLPGHHLIGFRATASQCARRIS